MSTEEIKNEQEQENQETPQQELNEQEQKNESAEKDPAAEIEEWNKKYLLLYAEFDNYRKRTARERAELLKSAGSDVIKSILPVIDDLERAIKANEKADDIEVVKEGFRLIHHKFTAILQGKGLKPMEMMGQEFNADISEAIANVPVQDESQKGKVIDVVENGYTLNDAVIRYAKVVVGQ
ncbi:MAG: nucleotide exchange factor GrpE [Flavobacteriales bacterium]|nr:nucleotide exchange factor GrpE [Flavobacteriales bacterium]